MPDCPTCGASLRHWNDSHVCGPSDRSHIRFNLATTDEEKAEVSEAVRQVHGIDEDFWYRNRPEMFKIVQRLRKQRAVEEKG